MNQLLCQGAHQVGLAASWIAEDQHVLCSGRLFGGCRCAFTDLKATEKDRVHTVVRHSVDQGLELHRLVKRSQLTPLMLGIWSITSP
jgi:hypothetical protein